MAPGDGEQLSGDSVSVAKDACMPCWWLHSSDKVLTAEAELRRKAAEGALTDSEAAQLNRLKGKGAAPVADPEVWLMYPCPRLRLMSSHMHFLHWRQEAHMEHRCSAAVCPGGGR